MEKDKARMAQVFLELDEDADGLWVSVGAGGTYWIFTALSVFNGAL